MELKLHKNKTVVSACRFSFDFFANATHCVHLFPPQVTGGVIKWKVVSTGKSGIAETSEDGGFTLHILDKQYKTAKNTVEEIEISFSKTTNAWETFVGWPTTSTFFNNSARILNKRTAAACREGLAPGQGYFFSYSKAGEEGFCKHITVSSVAAVRRSARAVRSPLLFPPLILRCI